MIVVGKVPVSIQPHLVGQFTLYVSFTYILEQYILVCFKFKFYISIILIRRSLYFVSFNVWINPRTYSS